MINFLSKLIEDPLNLALVALTAVIAAATVAYVIVTIKLANETKLLRKAQTDPLISLHFGAYSNFMLIELRNVGLGPAYNLHFNIIDNIEVHDGKHLTDLNILKDLRYLAPKQEISYELADYNDLKGKTFRIAVNYQNKLAEEYNEEFIFDINEREGSLMSAAPIEGSLSRIATSLDRIDGKIQRPQNPLSGFRSE